MLAAHSGWRQRPRSMTTTMARRKRGGPGVSNVEADLPAEQPEAGQDAWVPAADEDPCWPEHSQRPPRKGTRASHRLSIVRASSPISDEDGSRLPAGDQAGPSLSDSHPGGSLLVLRTILPASAGGLLGEPAGGQLGRPSPGLAAPAPCQQGAVGEPAGRKPVGDPSNPVGCRC